MEAFIEAVRSSTLPERAVFDDATPGNWSAALRQLAGVLADDRPTVVVIDEVPYLIERVDAFRGHPPARMGPRTEPQTSPADPDRIRSVHDGGAELLRTAFPSARPGDGSRPTQSGRGGRDAPSGPGRRLRRGPGDRRTPADLRRLAARPRSVAVPGGRTRQPGVAAAGLGRTVARRGVSRFRDASRGAGDDRQRGAHLHKHRPGRRRHLPLNPVPRRPGHHRQTHGRRRSAPFHHGVEGATLPGHRPLPAVLADLRGAPSGRDRTPPRRHHAGARPGGLDDLAGARDRASPPRIPGAPSTGRRAAIGTGHRLILDPIQQRRDRRRRRRSRA